MNKNVVHACLALWIVLLSEGFLTRFLSTSAVESSHCYWSKTITKLNFFLVEDSEELCPEGFFHHGSSCYFFSANLESDWIEAGVTKCFLFLWYHIYFSIHFASFKLFNKFTHLFFQSMTHYVNLDCSFWILRHRMLCAFKINPKQRKENHNEKRNY